MNRKTFNKVIKIVEEHAGIKHCSYNDADKSIASNLRGYIVLYNSTIPKPLSEKLTDLKGVTIKYGIATCNVTGIQSASIRLYDK